MSYVGLKHLLADLALEAVRDPAHADWVRPLAAYGEAATPRQPDVLLDPSDDVDRLVEAGLLERRDGRVSCKSAFVPHLAYLQRQTTRLRAAVERLTRSSTYPGVPDDLVRGAALFNAGLFFEAHELLETTWRATKGPERDFYHGIVQAAASFYHYEKRNMHGARTLLSKSIGRLGAYPSSFLGIDLESLKRSLAGWQDYLSRQEPETAKSPEMPSVRFAAT